MTKRVIAVMLSMMLLIGSLGTMVFAATLSGEGFTDMLGNVDAFMQTKTPAQRQTIYDFLEVYTSTNSGMDTLIGLVDDQSSVSQLVSDYIRSYGVSEAEKQTLKMLLTVLKCIPVEVRRTAVEDLHDFVPYADYDASDVYADGTVALRAHLFAGSAAEGDGLTDAVFYQLAYNLRDLVVFTADVADPNFDYEFYGFTNMEFKTNINRILRSAFPELNGTRIVSAEHFMMLLCDMINADTTVSADMKRAVAETLVTTNSFVYGSSALTLSISTTDPTAQKTGYTTPVTVTLDATMADTSATGLVPAVEWYVNDELVQYTGEQYVFTPSVVGTYEIKAVSGGVTSNIITVTLSASTTTVVTPDSGSTGTGGISGGISGGIGTGTGTQPNVPSPSQPNAYPEIPAPTKVGFVTQNGITKTISAEKVTFEDVEGHWSEDYVEVLATAGFLRGQSASEYRPDWGITREEMAVVLARVLGVEGKKATNYAAFSDHDTIQDFAVDAVYTLVEMGVYKGYGEGHFGPQRILTREEISALFSRILGDSSLKQDTEFADHHEIADWFVEDVENLADYGIVIGYDDDTFRAQNDVTRAEAAVMLYKTLYRMGILK